MGVLTLWTARELIAGAAAVGVTLAEREGRLTVRGPRTVDPELLEQLRIRREEILEALAGLPETVCAGCGTPDVAFESWASEWWCHRCARRRGLALLRAEQPNRFPPEPAPPAGCVADPDGNVWRIRCRCGLHEGRGKGHDAKPVNAVYEFGEAP